MYAVNNANKLIYGKLFDANVVALLDSDSYSVKCLPLLFDLSPAQGLMRNWIGGLL